jgi:polyisoprenoid-binding protein YceI
MAKWVIDSDHAAARFGVRHFMIANVVGLFSGITGVIHFDPPDISHLSLEAEIDVASLTTGHPMRDEHLLSSDFFDAGKYPKIIFKSTGAEVTGGRRFSVTGDLTLRGMTHPVTLEAEYFGPVKSPFSGKICVGFTATGKINREDYGMTWNEAMEGGVVMGKEVQITIELEADLTTDEWVDG